ncbi:unnamed protein product [Brugia pahangi]|uniref:Uncharacterized protein n=1 Tax=Brugia pahangi TaxID=6280 RepID=A0A0N4THW7_BRUPA|nr:unnamed protein product [Brugia pahangi]
MLHIEVHKLVLHLVHWLQILVGRSEIREIIYFSSHFMLILILCKKKKSKRKKEICIIF